MKMMIITELSTESQVQRWLVAGVREAEKAKDRFLVLLGGGKRKAKP